MKEQQFLDKLLFLNTLRKGLWFFGISSWSFGIIDRSIAALADGFLSAIDIMQLFTASFFFVSWLFLKPASKLKL
jgi:hypothetical protein